MDQRQRQRQRRARQARLEAERLAHRTRRRRLAAVGAVIAVAVGVAAVATFAGADGDRDAEGRADASDTTTSGTGEDGEAGSRCPPAVKPADKPASFAAPFPRCIEDGIDYGAVLTTSKGSFTVDLDEAAAPETVNNFVALSRYGWFDDDDFHRVVAGFVIQGGDPFGEPPGTGGPGYTIEDELPDGVDAYVEGAVAMANSGPDSGGSQFFVCPRLLQPPRARLLALRSGHRRHRGGQGHQRARQRRRPPHRAGGHRVGGDHRGLS